MRTRIAEAPFNSPDHLFEVKWDGIRALVSSDDDGVRITDRHGGDLLPLVPELRDLRLPDGIVLDGELIVCDRRGRPSYDLLAGRLGPKAARRGRGPLFVAFDLLYDDRRSLLPVALEDRRARLLERGITGRGVVVPEHLESDGEPFFDAVAEYGLEGIVAKRRSSPYLPGTRTADWLVHHVEPRADVVLGGLRTDQRAGVRAVLCGMADEGLVRFAGEAYVPPFLGNWLAEATRDFRAQSSPFSTPLGMERDLVWLRPRLVGIVEHAGWEGGELRDARFRALRLDGRLDDCVMQDPVPVPSLPTRGPAERPRLVVLQSLPFGP